MMQELTRQEELQWMYSDMYKDAHGFRPRHIDTSGWSEEQFNEELESLQHAIADSELLRKAAEEKAVVAFEMRVQTVIACGAKDRAMALRWIHEAEGSNGDDDYLCYLVGLPYRYFAK